MKKRTVYILKKIPLLFFLLTLGCATTLPPAPKLPGAVHVKSLTVPRSDTLALHPEGKYLALVADGVQLIEVGSGKVRSISQQKADLLAWSADGERLALTFSGGDTSRIRIVDVAGNMLREQQVEGVATDLVWNGEELLAAGYALSIYSFGGNLKSLLHRLGADGTVKSDVLHDVTLRPGTVKSVQGMLKKAVRMKLSPYGDEIVYTRLQDPPMFSPYIQVVLRHLENGQELPVGKMGQGVGAVLYAAGGEQVLFGDGIGRTVSVDPWSGTETGSFARPGRALAGSSNQDYLAIDNVLYFKGKELVGFSGKERYFFSPHVGYLAVVEGRAAHLFRLEGVEKTGPFSDADKERLLRLRSWRSQGLIDHQEYLEQKEGALRHEQ